MSISWAGIGSLPQRFPPPAVAHECKSLADSSRGVCRLRAHPARRHDRPLRPWIIGFPRGCRRHLAAGLDDATAQASAQRRAGHQTPAGHWLDTGAGHAQRSGQPGSAGRVQLGAGAAGVASAVGGCEASSRAARLGLGLLAERQPAGQHKPVFRAAGQARRSVRRSPIRSPSPELAARLAAELGGGGGTARDGARRGSYLPRARRVRPGRRLRVTRLGRGAPGVAFNQGGRQPRQARSRCRVRGELGEPAAAERLSRLWTWLRRHRGWGGVGCHVFMCIILACSRVVQRFSGYDCMSSVRHKSVHNLSDGTFCDFSDVVE